VLASGCTCHYHIKSTNVEIGTQMNPVPSFKYPIYILHYENELGWLTDSAGSNDLPILLRRVI
jgi:hypothetical protein